MLRAEIMRVDGNPGGMSHHRQVFAGVLVALEACGAEHV